MTNMFVTIGRTNSTPTVAAMAPAPLRTMNPKPRPSRPKLAIASRLYSSGMVEPAGSDQSMPLSPKIGALINTIPAGVLGGVTFVLYGLIGIVGVRMWVDGEVDFSRPKNQFTAGVALVVGIANVTWTFGGIQLTGIALGTLAALIIFHVMDQLGRVTGTEQLSEPAEKVELCLFDRTGRRETDRIPLPEYTHEVWHGYFPDLRPGQLYGLRAHGPYAPEEPVDLARYRMEEWAPASTVRHPWVRVGRFTLLYRRAA